MSDQELVRSRERETIPGGDYESLYARREEFTARGMKGDILIKESDRDWSVSRQGHLKFYLLGEVYPDTALQYWYVFVHDIYQPDWDEVASELAQMEVSQDFKDIYGG